MESSVFRSKCTPRRSYTKPQTIASFNAVLGQTSHEPPALNINVLSLWETHSPPSLVHIQCLQCRKKNQHCKTPSVLGLMQQRYSYGDNLKPASSYAVGADSAVLQPGRMKHLHGLSPHLLTHSLFWRSSFCPGFSFLNSLCSGWDSIRKAG